MSLEKRREPRGNKEKEILEESSFRRLDFKPLGEPKEKRIDTEEIKEEIV